MFTNRYCHKKAIEVFIKETIKNEKIAQYWSLSTGTGFSVNTFCLSVVNTPTNGKINVDISSLGLTTKPYAVIPSSNFDDAICTYDYDNSNTSATNLVFSIKKYDGSNYTDALRFSAVVFGY